MGYTRTAFGGTPLPEQSDLLAQRTVGKLKRSLGQNGWTELKDRGSGSHTVYKKEGVCGIITLKKMKDTEQIPPYIRKQIAELTVSAAPCPAPPADGCQQPGKSSKMRHHK